MLTTVLVLSISLWTFNLSQYNYTLQSVYIKLCILIFPRETWTSIIGQYEYQARPRSCYEK